ncbi:hypothetical protein O181_002521 [Austropuccinia psidii MF-1]|uniref:Uncharacterized protein n=1 Tax=Austropuccinia psidii MF-1 TaxID=1389203 RepID=A0A9Q3GDC3_9BASI|nr:hypothetical protein [Austropuccinia psidii MF-1]
MLARHFTSNADDNQARIFLEFLALKHVDTLEQFISDITQHIGKIDSVGIMIGSPGDIKESLIAEIIVRKLNDNYVNTREILQNKCPLTILKVIDYLEQRSQDTVDSNESRIKNEAVFNTQGNISKTKNKRTYAKCTNGQHNPKTKHSASECRELKKKLSQKGRTNNAMRDYNEE